MYSHLVIINVIMPKNEKKSSDPLYQTLTFTEKSKIMQQ